MNKNRKITKKKKKILPWTPKNAMQPLADPSSSQRALQQLSRALAWWLHIRYSGSPAARGMVGCCMDTFLGIIIIIKK